MTSADELPITLLSNHAEDYVQALARATTRAKLDALLQRYAPLVQDAIAAAPKDELEFALFRAGLRKERRGQFGGEGFVDRFGAVLMPALMVDVALVAARLGVPFGLVFIRMQKNGGIARDAAGNYYRTYNTKPQKDPAEEPTP